MFGTYKIVNILNGRYYYGSSYDITKRFQQHKRDLTKGNHHCIYLQRAYNKYGADKFLFQKDILFEKIEDARKHEQKILDSNEKLYNMSRLVSIHSKSKLI